MNIAVALVAVGLLVFLAHLLDDLFARTKVPDVLLLLGLGLLVGAGLSLPSGLRAGPIAKKHPWVNGPAPVRGGIADTA